MSYRLAQIPMTLNFLEDHSLIASFLEWHRTALKFSTDVAELLVFRRPRVKFKVVHLLQVFSNAIISSAVLQLTKYFVNINTAHRTIPLRQLV